MASPSTIDDLLGIIVLASASTNRSLVLYHSPYSFFYRQLMWLGVAFVFGLLHGFGFAGALHEIGLPERDVPTALLTFNLGVEAGQLLIVLACLGAIAAVTRVAAFAVAPLTRMATYAIGMVASYWLIERLA